MPDDGVSDFPILVGEGQMAEAGQSQDLAQGVLGVLTAQLIQTGNVAQNNFVTVQKAVDYDYLENKRMVTLDEAVGVREVASKVTPGGPSPAVS